MHVTRATLLIAAFALSQAQAKDPAKLWLEEAKRDVAKHKQLAAERALRQAVALWEPLEPKPKQYLDAIGLLGVVTEGRLVDSPEALRTQLEPILASAARRIASSGFTGNSLAAARVLEAYGLLLQRTGREKDAMPFYSQAKALRFPGAQSPAPTTPSNGPGVSAPSLLRRKEPEYSDDARLAKYEGTVVLSAIIDERGLARDIRIVRNLGLGLDEQAIAVLKQWVFRPGRKNGVPVATRCTITVNFRLANLTRDLHF